MKELTKKRKKKNSKGRYITVRPNVRLDIFANEADRKYYAEKRVMSVRCGEYFANISDAELWLKTYIPSELRNPIDETLDTDERAKRNSIITFYESWKLYKNGYLKNETSTSTYRNRVRKEILYRDLFSLKMREITPRIITEWLRVEKSKCREGFEKKSRRCNFNDDLKALKAFFNWWKEESEDMHFNNPILIKHKKTGKIKETPYRNKKMEPHELNRFFDALGDKTLWQDLAKFQFFTASRIQEVATIQVERIDLVNRTFLIKEVAVWGVNKKLAEIKSLPKNEQPELVYLNDTLLDIALRRLNWARPFMVEGRSYNLMFHFDVVPLSYRQIQYHYNKALKKCGLHKKYSGTHIMRHSMGTITRSVTGNLDSAQAVTRHKDAKVAQQYSELDYELQKKAANAVENFLKNESCTAGPFNVPPTKNNGVLRLVTCSDVQ